MLFLTLAIEVFNLTFLKLPELYALEAQSDQKISIASKVPSIRLVTNSQLSMYSFIILLPTC
jgi:hypothetical protein